jgi:hypothetical protein
MPLAAAPEKICRLFVHTRETAPILCPPEPEDKVAGWDRNADWNHDVLEHIVALLFSLAGLAELAAGAPLLRRRHVLGILGQGEVEAWSFVMGVSVSSVPADVPETADDAARLAASFRALALALCAVLAQVERFARTGAASAPAGWRNPVKQADRQAPAAPDTS